MDKSYWLGRKHASLEMARNATNSAARLIHYDLAGRYGVNASFAESPTTSLEDCLPPPIGATPEPGND